MQASTGRSGPPDRYRPLPVLSWTGNGGRQPAAVGEPTDADVRVARPGGDPGERSAATRADPARASILRRYVIYSTSKPEIAYEVRLLDEVNAVCTCPDAAFRKHDCKHISVAREREGFRERCNRLWELMDGLGPGALFDQALHKAYTLGFRAEGYTQEMAEAEADDAMRRWREEAGCDFHRCTGATSVFDVGGRGWCQNHRQQGNVVSLACEAGWPALSLLPVMVTVGPGELDWRRWAGRTTTIDLDIATRLLREGRRL